MPYRELSMIEVREVLRQYVGGAGLRAIARGTGLDRKTAAKYIAAGSGCGLRPGGAPPTDDQVAMVPSGATAAAPSWQERDDRSGVQGPFQRLQRDQSEDVDGQVGADGRPDPLAPDGQGAERDPRRRRL